MAKKLNVWLNNKLNKSLHYTIVIKFYRIFVTELVLTFFVFKYQSHFEFPKGGKQSPRLKIPEIPGVSGGSSKTPWNRKSWGVGSKSLPCRGGMDIFWNHTLSVHRSRLPANCNKITVCWIVDQKLTWVAFI